MDNKEKEELKEKSIEMFLNGENIIDISKKINYSRNFVGKLIKDDKRIIEYRNKRKIKVYKYKNQCKMNVPISVEFLEKIGISRDVNNTDFVDVQLDELNQIITIKKHTE